MLRRLVAYSSCTAIVSGFGGYSYLKYQYSKNSIGDAEYNTSAIVPSREQMLQSMKNNNYDIIIIGGGATGAGVALDASTRGLRTCLLESGDFACGTSSKSTKLIHGGVRYLEDAIKHLDISKLLLVCEALEERSHLMKSCEYMCHPVPIILPIFNFYKVPYFITGVKVYDILAKLLCCFQTGVPDCHYITKSNCLLKMPLIKSENLIGGIVYYDGSFNDSRMNLQILLTSTLDNYVDNQTGAHIANYCKVLDFIKDSNNKNIIGVNVKDKISGETFSVFGKIFVNCSGSFSDTIRHMDDMNCKPLLKQSSGSHIVLPKRYTKNEYGLISPETSDDRVLFLLPWEGSTIVGTTDELCNLTDSPRPKKNEIDFIIREISKNINVDTQEIMDDIKSEWCGIRPLVSPSKKQDDKDDSTAKLTRSHSILCEPNGLVSVIGGKWTTYRRMAQDTLDAILRQYDGRIVTKGPCKTKNLKLYGSFDDSKQFAAEDVHYGSGKLPAYITKKYPDVKYDEAEHLVRNYGFQSLKILEIGSDNNLNSRLHPDYPFLKSEVIYAVRHEMARRVSDVIGRRIRLAFVNAEAARSVIPTVTSLMSAELNWKSKDVRDSHIEAENYLESFTAV